MTTRRQLLLPLALAPVAGWAIWAAGAPEPASHSVGPFHLPLDETTAIWRDLAQVRLAGPTGDPQFPTKISALDGQRVTARGFMVPLSEGNAHTRFILAANPVSCPVCQTPAPATMLYVHSRVPLRETQEPVVLSGTLRLRPHDGLFYRLDRAEEQVA